MDVVHERCAGLDVHKKTVVACVLRSVQPGMVDKEVRTFGTMLTDLETLSDWLVECGCTHVAMEATGVFWKPIYNVLEQRSELELLVVNAHHLKTVPGRKTDVKDAEWIATLLRHGLVRASLIPDRHQRELRELTRYRTALVRQRADEVNRLQKTLEGANIKLAGVLTDVTGVSGQRILEALIGEGDNDPQQLAELAHARVLKHKRAALEQAVAGRLTDVLRFVVQQQLQHLHDLEEQIAACDAKIEEQLRPFASELERLDSITGVGQRTAQVILVEVGLVIERFPSARHVAAWAGMAPGNRQSGGKRQHARTRKGSPWLRGALTEAAWAASKSKHDGYLPALFRRLSTRRGKKRALVAVGHSILVTAYYLLTRGGRYEDLGERYFDERDRQNVLRRSLRRIEGLGYTVHLEPTQTTAA
jgi:transposase